jgi:hypothetical protein
MAATSHDTWTLEDEKVAKVCLKAAQQHDQYWAWAHSRESYFRAGLDYEDYAPAYCVGHVGHQQYGGDFDDAEKSMLSNWLRLKGDSRLSLDEARMAIRAAWDHTAAVAQGITVERAQPAPLAQQVARVLETANAWLDDVEGRLFGTRPHARPLARRAQQGGFARH